MENEHYRDNLEAILAISGGKLVLNVREVSAITGYADPRTVRKHYPITPEGTISAATLARCLCPASGKRRQTVR